ncbi:hypothetical protein [Parvularcula lutaonensis]|uniref:Uncharacterized protein n=1 Tax=Parvularcula lutaonensis TaxID=491923 RepID=A0ABV7M7I4_9PROT|nr:hypothetical protein [Parvularcula lutaonensis]
MVQSSRPSSYLSVISCGKSPDSWPIEVGWGFAAGEIRTMLLKPAGSWSLAAWNKGCEADHKIGLETLLQEGKPALDACLILNAALGQSDVYAGAPETDSLWLYKLYKAAGVEPNFRLHPMADANLQGLHRAEDVVVRLREEAGVAQTA